MDLKHCPPLTSIFVVSPGSALMKTYYSSAKGEWVITTVMTGGNYNCCNYPLYTGVSPCHYSWRIFSDVVAQCGAVPHIHPSPAHPSHTPPRSPSHTHTPLPLPRAHTSHSPLPLTPLPLTHTHTHTPHRFGRIISTKSMMYKNTSLCKTSHNDRHIRHFKSWPALSAD